MLESSMMNEARRVARERFGLESLRPAQESVIKLLLEPAEGVPPSAVAIFPTGGGKSLCYQLPALLFTDSLTVVVSPLLALMKDQVDNLVKLGIPAASLNSTQDFDEAREIKNSILDNTTRIIFVSPERFKNTNFQEMLQKVPLALLAIDEAHCVSQWGHSFRADYRRLAYHAVKLPFKRFLGLTATATKKVELSICDALNIPPACVVRLPSARHNLVTRVTRVQPSGAITGYKEGDKGSKSKSVFERIHLLARRLKEREPGAAIVYCTLQATTATVAEGLRQQGISARCYHAGLTKEKRVETQQWFMDDHGQNSPVIVGTIAFGMGIDKADIRYVYHFNLPKSLDGYQQEIGRAGRDGKESVCELLACVDDVPTISGFVRGTVPTEKSVRGLLDMLFKKNEAGVSATFNVSRFSRDLDLTPNVIEQLICDLEIDQGVIRQLQPYYESYKCLIPRGSSKHLAVYGDVPWKQAVRSGKPGSKFVTVKSDVAAKSANMPPWKIAGLLEKARSAGLFESISGIVVMSRVEVLKPLEDIERVAKRLHGVLNNSMNVEMDLVNQVLDFAKGTRCHKKIIAERYGDKIPEEDCGQCEVTMYGAQEPEKFGKDLATIVDRPFDEDRWRNVCESNVEKHPLVLARVAAGINSPFIAKMKYKKLQAFGSMADTNYEKLLERATEFCE